MTPGSSSSRVTSTPFRRTGNFPGAREGDAIVGRGAADMKGALAVMLEIGGVGRAGIRARPTSTWGSSFFGREELPITQSALLPFFDRCSAPRERSTWRS